jgi:formamidopyrimidine-DNA glycosylase
MPELPEVETVRRGLEPVMTGALLERVEVRRPDLRYPLPRNFVERLTGQRILSLGRRAKYLLADLSSGEVLIMHLGMSGRFLVTDGGGVTSEPGEFHAAGTGAERAHDHVVFTLSNGTRVTYNDARRFGFMDLLARPDLEASRHFKALGIEPLGNELDGALLARLFFRKATPLKAALLDQSLVAGLGNIYVCEALHRARLSPRRAAGTLTRKGGGPAAGAERLSQAIRDVLADAVAAGGSTLRDYARTDGSLGDFQHRFRVYGREGEPCPTPGCSGIVRRFTQGGRSTYHCPSCQR